MSNTLENMKHDNNYLYKEPSEVKISTMTLVSNIKDKLLDSDLEGDNIDKNNDFNLDILCRIIKTFPLNSDILNTNEGGIINIDYHTTFPTKFAYENLIKFKRNPFFNQMSVILKTFAFKTVNVKIFNNSKLQMTGVLSENEGKNVSKKIINILKTSKLKIYTHDAFLSKKKSYSDNSEIQTNEYIIVYNPKTDKLFYYRWNYLDIIDEITTNLKITLFDNKEEIDDLKSKKGWISDNTITKFITLFKSKLDNLSKVKEHIISQLQILNDLKEKKSFENMNTLNVKHEDEINTLNTQIYELNKNNSLINITNNDLTNMYNKIKHIQEVDNDVIKNVKEKFKDELQQLNELDNLNEYYEFNIIDDIDKIKHQNTKIELINSDFSTQFPINNTKLNEIVKNKYKSFSSYEPNDYPGVKNKFFWNADNIKNKKEHGKCHCSPNCIKRGKKSLCVQITISVFQSGSVIITGAKSITQVKDAYKYINDIFKAEFDNIKGKITEEDIIKSKDKINNNRKIMRKPRLFYFKKEDVFPDLVNL
jgi:TATA-box binding protein (TBP) (component of TFIID and TFIIIB)